MSYERYREMEKTHVCSMCGGELVTVWDAEGDCYRLCCGVDHTHNGFQQRLSPQKALQRGQADNVMGPGVQKDLEERAKRSETALSWLPRTDIATGQALGVAKIGELVLWAEQIGLTAHLGHVCLYFGEPYVTIDGYYYLLDKRKQGMTIGVRPMTKEERKAYKIWDEDYAWICKAWAGGEELAAIGVGIVTKEEIEKPSKRNPEEFRAPVVHDHPQRMAEKRAEWQLLRKLIPLEILEKAERAVTELEDKLEKEKREVKE